MDTVFHGMFSEWIKEQRNLPAAIGQFCTIANEYPLEQIIVVVKWLISGWKLKSNIMLITNLTLGWNNEQDLALLVKEVANRWKAPYVAELAASVMERWDHYAMKNSDGQSINGGHDHDEAVKKKQQFLLTLMKGWDFAQVNNVFFYLGSKVEWEVKSGVYLQFRSQESFSFELKETFNSKDGQKNTLKFDSPQLSSSNVATPKKILLSPSPPRPFIQPATIAQNFDIDTDNEN
jgi:hypothetical protein